MRSISRHPIAKHVSKISSEELSIISGALIAFFDSRILVSTGLRSFLFSLVTSESGIVQPGSSDASGRRTRMAPIITLIRLLFAGLLVHHGQC